jgi:hypothetical protein
MIMIGAIQVNYHIVAMNSWFADFYFIFILICPIISLLYVGRREPMDWLKFEEA